MTITEFLLARIAEDEVDARDAHYEGQRWIPEEEAVVAADKELDPVMFLDRKRDAHHAANWSPARVLAECEAKRRIVELHTPGSWISGPSGDLSLCPTCAYWVDEDDGLPRHEAVTAEGDLAEERYPCETFRLLALPYADHPDYREEWRP